MATGQMADTMCSPSLYFHSLACVCVCLCVCVCVRYAIANLHTMSGWEHFENKEVNCESMLFVYVPSFHVSNTVQHKYYAHFISYDSMPLWHAIIDSFGRCMFSIFQIEIQIVWKLILVCMYFVRRNDFCHRITTLSCSAFFSRKLQSHVTVFFIIRYLFLWIISDLQLQWYHFKQSERQYWHRFFVMSKM